MVLDSSTNSAGNPDAGSAYARVEEPSGGQYLTFMLAAQEYGVDILRVQEIKGWDSVTRIPNTPAYIKGVLNLRGTIVPIVDLRLRFGLESIPYGAVTVIVVVKVRHEKSTRTMGVVVDGVSDVYHIPPEQIKPAPDFGSSVRTEFIKGMATMDEKMVILLDLDRLLNADEMNVVANAADTARN
jgi:purine-binding chemotaxis protein CheW